MKSQNWTSEIMLDGKLHNQNLIFETLAKSQNQTCLIILVPKS